MEEDKPKQATPPYLPYKTFRNFLGSLKVAIPGRIDRTIMRNYAGTVQSQLLATLVYLRLIEPDGTPTERLTKLVPTEGADRQKMLREILKVSYGLLFDGHFDVANATVGQLNDAFAKIGTTGDTTRKCVAFFLSAARDAGLPLSPHLRMRRGGRAGVPRRKPKAANGGQPTNGGATANSWGAVGASIVMTPYQLLIDILDPTNMNEEEQAAVWTLIRYLKKKEAPGS